MVLDLGCGDAHDSANHAVGTYVGIDVDAQILRQSPWRDGAYLVCSRGEQLPFRDETFPLIVSRVAIPYMDIPTVARELYRVAAPGATISLTGHPPSFTLQELRTIRAVKPFIYRCYVLVNGLWFHASGRLFRFPLKRSRIESFQTSRSLKRALGQAGFGDLTIVPPLTVTGRKLDLPWREDEPAAMKRAE